MLWTHRIPSGVDLAVLGIARVMHFILRTKFVLGTALDLYSARASPIGFQLDCTFKLYKYH